jgi:hypothetical protein
MQLEMFRPPDAFDYSDPAHIARKVYHEKVLDALKVLRNLGALTTTLDRAWCLEELQLLIALVSPGEPA